MDLDGFREPQSPFFFNQPPTWLLESSVKRKVVPAKQTDPTPDNRFPGWAAPMSDGRVGTDYRPNCALNFPTGTQFASRQFLQKNAESIIQTTRKRVADSLGAGLSYDSSTVVPASMVVQCDNEKCTMSPYVERGIGVERQENVPELFGTFSSSSPSLLRPAEPIGTTRYEGGRNTVRGRVGKELIG
jgi:hypothetical protein